MASIEGEHNAAEYGSTGSRDTWAKDPLKSIVHMLGHGTARGRAPRTDDDAWNPKPQTCTLMCCRRRPGRAPLDHNRSPLAPP